MPEVQPGMTPLARLVLCMICLSVAGSFAAGIHWYAVDLPTRQEVQVPVNNENDDAIACKKACDATDLHCEYYCNRYDEGCRDRCISAWAKCLKTCGL